MAARHRRRRRAAPRRRARRWLRRQDRFTRGLLGAVALLSLLVVALFSVLLREDRSGRRVERTEARPARPATAHGRRTGAPAPARTAAVPAPAPRPVTSVRPAKTVEPRPGAAVAKPGDAPPSAPALPPVARAAIVIDDLGQSFSHFEQLAVLDLPLSLAVIPGLPAAARTAREAARRGIELLVHQPMEPHEATGKDPGAGVLLSTMPGEEIRSRLRASLDEVPDAVGVNNHMGSRFTEDAAALDAVMAELRERRLFWLDSRTSPATRGLASARAAGVPAVARDIFLDAQVDPAFIRGQLRKLLETARARGAAVAIGHPHPETIAALRELRDELLASGVRLVPVSRLVRGTASGAPALEAPAVIARQGRAAPADRPPAAGP